MEGAKGQAKTAVQQTYLWTARSWLTLYRQLCVVIVCANLVLIVVASAGGCEWASRRRVQFAVANTLVTVLTRNEVRPCKSACPRWYLLFVLRNHLCGAGVLTHHLYMLGQACDIGDSQWPWDAVGALSCAKLYHKLPAAFW